MPPRSPPFQSFELLAGQRVDVSLAQGEGLRVVAGEVVLMRPARWLGETLVTPGATRLREGDGWAGGERECVTLLGCTASRVVRVGC